MGSKRRRHVELCYTHYSGENFVIQVQELVKATVTVVKRSECHKFVVLPKRWIVERSFGWLENVADFGKIVNEN
ncbi:Transposase, IS4 [Beggiatoa sp. PS]|nr:Transposase, IS4 [Beggiatoa sp. PS]